MHFEHAVIMYLDFEKSKAQHLREGFAHCAAAWFYAQCDISKYV